MTKQHKRPPAPIPDWAADATEARRQRDEAAKQRTAELDQQGRQARNAANAWSPQHKTSRHQQRGGGAR